MSEYVRSGGFDIYTSLSQKQQKKLQKSVDTVLSGFTEKQSDNRYAVQGAAVCVDNETGYVTAIVGVSRVEQ
jgi:penicillin-binding protein 1A